MGWWTMWPQFGGFRDYEVIYLMATQGYTIRAIGINYVDKTWTEYGTAFAGKEESIDIDNSDTFLFGTGGATRTTPVQYVWRGTCFSSVYSEDLGGNGANDLLTLSGIQQFFTCGQAAFGHGIWGIDYETAETFDFDVAYSRTATNDDWSGLFDLRYGNNGAAQKGDALVAQPGNGQYISTYNVSGGALALSPVDQMAASSLGNKAAWSCDRDSGIMTSHSTAASLFRAYQIDMSDLTISYIGELTSTDQNVLAVAVVPDETDMYITLENSGTSNDIVRTYRESAGTLTKLDELTINDDTNTSAHFRVSPYTKRIWLLSQSHASAFEVDTDGNITELIELPYTVGSSGYTGNFIAFTKDPSGLSITTNGFTGIKQKLYEAWEFEEVGNVTRAGSMGNADMYVNAGSIPDRTGSIGQAADFDGASNFYVSPAGGAATVPPIELMTQGSFSGCFDFLLDTLTPPAGTTQYIFARGRFNAWVDLSQFDVGCGVGSAGNIFFWVKVGSTNYQVTSTVTASASTKYHLYFEYDKTNQTVGISVNDETLVTAALPAASSINVYNGSERRFSVGRLTSNAGNQQYMDGYPDQFFWFWDTLTTAERTWMYNSGSSRNFSEL